jgi:hypothetical protein
LINRYSLQILIVGGVDASAAAIVIYHDGAVSAQYIDGIINGR